MFLIGVWKGEGATDQDTKYSEETKIFNVKGPNYFYTQMAYKLPQNILSHVESGFFRIFPDEQKNDGSGKIELLTTQQRGRCIIEEGTYTKDTVILQSRQITVTTNTDQPFVTEVKRKYWLDEQNNLNYKIFVGSSNFLTKDHLNGKLVKQLQ